ncbi:MAG: acyltransferase [Sphingomonadaceae bacterium]|nr:acyltransferase [Sphingomonadaceae bacterium]
MTHPGSKTRLAELDALRGIAAVCVMLFHYTVQAPNVLPHVQTISVGVPWGSYGVELFFAISGFVIFMTLERTRSTGDFAVARFARLFPAYWAGIVLTTLLISALGATALAQPAQVVLTNFTMLQGFFYVPAVDGVYWSLTVELAFYGCMWGLWRLGALRKIEQILIAWIALRLVWWLVPFAPSVLGKALLVEHISYFAIGIAAYRVRQGERRWVQQIPLLLFGLGMTGFFDGAGAALVYAIATIVFVALVAERLSFLDKPVLLWLGALSYPLYLVHQNIGYALMAVLESLGVSPFIATIAAIAAALGLAQLVRDCIEQPALRGIRAVWKSRQLARTV